MNACFLDRCGLGQVGKAKRVHTLAPYKGFRRLKKGIACCHVYHLVGRYHDVKASVRFCNFAHDPWRDLRVRPDLNFTVQTTDGLVFDIGKFAQIAALA